MRHLLSSSSGRKRTSEIWKQRLVFSLLFGIKVEVEVLYEAELIIKHGEQTRHPKDPTHHRPINLNILSSI